MITKLYECGITYKCNVLCIVYICILSDFFYYTIIYIHIYEYDFLLDSIIRITMSVALAILDVMFSLYLLHFMLTDNKEIGFR